MAFDEIQFPADIAYGSKLGPSFSTDVVILSSGYEQANQNWAFPRRKFDVSSGIKTDAQLADVIAFGIARAGRARYFRMKDWTDYQLGSALGSGTQLIGVGDGHTTTFQLVKSYVNGGVTVLRTILKPVAPPAKVYVPGLGWQTAPNTVVIYTNGSRVPSGWSVDATTGIVTISPAPWNGQIVAADAEFDTPARFDTDEISPTLEDYDANSLKGIPVIEVRL